MIKVIITIRSSRETIREIKGIFSMMTPFDLEAGVKGQIRQKIRRL